MVTEKSGNYQSSYLPLVPPYLGEIEEHDASLQVQSTSQHLHSPLDGLAAV
jgi:hypothetical protein